MESVIIFDMVWRFQWDAQAPVQLGRLDQQEFEVCWRRFGSVSQWPGFICLANGSAIWVALDSGQRYSAYWRTGPLGSGLRPDPARCICVIDDAPIAQVAPRNAPPPVPIKPALGNYRRRMVPQVERRGRNSHAPIDGDAPSPTTRDAKQPQSGINRRRFGMAPNPVLDEVE
jgi:hypothetical protein